MNTVPRKSVVPLAGFSQPQSAAPLRLMPQRVDDAHADNSPSPHGSRQPQAGLEAHPQAVQLAEGQSLTVLTSEGATLLTVALRDGAPVLQLGQDDAALSLPGKLSIEAGEISMKSSGPMQVRAGEDLVLRGKMIRLN